MTRTFSKIYGLAGLRIGWCYAPAQIVDALNRMRGPFNVNRRRRSRPASPRSRDRGHVERAVAHNELWLPRLTEALDRARAAG